MKVAMFGPFYPGPVEGGVEHHVRYLAGSLEKLGLEVERWSWKANDGEGIRKTGLFGLGGSFAKTDADIIHLHSTATAFSYFSGLGRFNGRSVSTIHAFFHPETESSLRLKLIGYGLSYPYKQALKRIRNNIAVSTYAKKEAQENGIPVKAVIGSGIPLAEIRKAAFQSELESDVALVARLNEQKGVFDFIKAFSNSGVRAVIAGYGNRGTEERVRILCEKGGIKCLIRPPRDVTLSVLKSSRAVAFPSRGDTFGIVCLEAMALGKPVIAYDSCGGPLDYLKDNENGLVVSSTPNSLAQGASTLLSDKKLLLKLSSNAKSTAESFDWPNVAKKVKEFYRQVLE